ncbi:PIN domain-containing protein [Chitinophaga sp. S165]|uniref:PIN domain-containing protein n=1 Tax=Chitinophaga sp. S165 TaxID=2135462 RepID=UPI0011B52859|nr:PIN domain-containing protein [Chitinophaga sp. S165]
MKILIDTNIYLDFYRSNKEGIILLSELIALDGVIILTDQIIQEFERSREKVLRNVLKNFEQESRLGGFTSSLLSDMEDFRELEKARKLYNNKKDKVIKLITAMLDDPSEDKIAVFFKQLVNKAIAGNKVWYTDDEIIKNAHSRKLIGNPPTTIDKYSIGDEINWEIVLRHIDEDTIIVGRDNAFYDNFSFLAKEFKKLTGHSLKGVTDRITNALKIVGIRPGDVVETAEKLLMRSMEESNYSEFWKRSAKVEETIL